MRRWLILLLVASLWASSLAGQQVVRRPIVAAASSTLNNNIVSFWKLDEATDSATWVDTPGTNDLTRVSVSGVLSVTGRVGNGAQPVASDGLMIADNASLSFTTDFAIAGWFKLDAVPTGGQYRSIISKADTGSTISYVLFLNGDEATNKLQWTASNDGTALSNLFSTTLGTPSTATWYFFYVDFDDAANVIRMSIDNGTVETVALTGSVHDNNSSFRIGHGPLWSQSFQDGQLDAIGAWSRKLTAGEVTELYNSGNGKEYPF